MKILPLLSVVLASVTAGAHAEPMALDDSRLADIRAGVALQADSQIQIVGFGGQTASSGPPAQIAISLDDGAGALPLILSEAQFCAAASCNQISTHLAVGITIQNLPAVLRGF